MGSTTFKPPQRKLPLSILTFAICAITFIALLYTESVTSFSSTNVFKFKSCAKKASPKSSKSTKGHQSEVENVVINYAADDRFEFDPKECNVAEGKWVFNSSYKPLYTDRSCPYLDRQVSCAKNGREDSDYRHWEWELDNCILPRFNPRIALEKIRGKRVMFVGDSLQRGQWQSFVCMVEFIIPQDQKSMRRGRVHTVFKAKEYNATIEFYWAPYLVESNSDVKIIGDPKKRIIRVDSVAKHAEKWIGVDILVFNTYVWWQTGVKIKSLWGSFANGEQGYEELPGSVSYNIALKTWANWIDSNIDPNITRVFFTTMSPTHQRSTDWDKKDGIKCFNETKPITKRGHWGTGSDKKFMTAVNNVGNKMKVPVTFINITQLSEYRIDAHASIYTELQGKLLDEEQKADPLHFADCIHWCIPGVPDTWNRILYAHL